MVPTLHEFKPFVLIGSSLGGYLSLMMMRDRPELMQSFTGSLLLCPAIDLPIFKLEDLTDEQYEIYKQEGVYDLDLGNDPENPRIVRLSKELIADALEKSILTGSEIDVNFPIRMMWGTEDTVVPPERSDILAHKFSG
jgi:pimeloyl-ACP methyl ester carboxylesterase